MNRTCTLMLSFQKSHTSSQELQLTLRKSNR